MNDVTPKFSFGTENDSEKYASTPTFYKLLLKSYENKTESLIKSEARRHLCSFSKLNKRKKNLSPVRKRSRDGTSEPKGQFEKFLVKRFQLRNDYDKPHVDEFLLSKEQAFKFPSRNDDIID